MLVAVAAFDLFSDNNIIECIKCSHHLAQHSRQVYPSLPLSVPVKELYFVTTNSAGEHQYRVPSGGKVQLNAKLGTGVACVAQTDGTELAPDMTVGTQTSYIKL